MKNYVIGVRILDVVMIFGYHGALRPRSRLANGCHDSVSIYEQGNPHESHVRRRMLD